MKWEAIELNKEYLLEPENQGEVFEVITIIQKESDWLVGEYVFLDFRAGRSKYVFIAATDRKTLGRIDYSGTETYSNGDLPESIRDPQKLLDRIADNEIKIGDLYHMVFPMAYRFEVKEMVCESEGEKDTANYFNKFCYKSEVVAKELALQLSELLKKFGKKYKPDIALEDSKN